MVGYAAIFAPNNENNPEIIWSVEYDEATAGGMNFHHMTLHYASQYTWNFEAQPWNGYVALEEFVNSYEAGDDRRKANFSIKLLEELQNKEAVSKFSSPLSGKNLPFSSLSDKLDDKSKKKTEE